MQGYGMLRRFLGAQWLAIGFIGGVSFVLSVFVARRFGPETFGVYAQATSFGILLAILVDGGFGKLLLREKARTSSALEEYSENLHGFAFGHAYMTIALLALLAIAGPFFSHRLTLLATVGAFGVTVLGQFSLAILRGQGRLVRDAAWQIGGRALTAASIAFALWWGADEPWEVLGAHCMGMVFFLLLLMRNGWVLPVFKIPKKIYAVVVPLIWLDLASVIYFRSDMLLCELLDMPDADVGAYAVAFRLIDAFLLLASPISLMLFRRFRLNVETPVRKIVIGIVRYSLLAGGMGGAIFVLALPTADIFFPLFFGEKFVFAGTLFKVLCFMLVFSLANTVLGQGVFALGLDRRYAWTATVAAVFNIGGNWLLMPIYGVWAAVWMTVATEVVVGIGLSAALLHAWKNAPSVRQHESAT
ncbi:MAG: oligosaccharide flippase family protein [Desulfobulbus sp.]|jgi:O-antigen/teichoic acid export membrane protein|uniref:oligosaccharide flippase family protein n=1 Tax=Desulfobulbus sp. TaxID=895 RepID=UPI00284A54B9|nr:oligosaccharide flippase family protein [Desulfobulbus sp.]MDR2548604.1 oligosaccharide flippase family protein [Desulfobulbus sp.]